MEKLGDTAVSCGYFFHICFHIIDFSSFFKWELSNRQLAWLKKLELGLKTWLILMLARRKYQFTCVGNKFVDNPEETFNTCHALQKY